jgi:hypothetical protein
MMTQLSRFDTCTRASLGHLLDISHRAGLTQPEHLSDLSIHALGGGTDNLIQRI